MVYMNTKKVRFGIIGAGTIARKFANDIKVVPNATLVAVASRTLEKAKIFQSYSRIRNVNLFKKG